MKKFRTVALMTAAVAAISLTACAGTATGSTAATSAAASATSAAASAAASTAEQPAQAASSASGKVYKVGVVRYMDHPSLNQIAESMEAELDTLGTKYGVTFDYTDYDKNGQGDGTTLNQIASDLIADKVDIIVPIATPSAQIVQAATEYKIPVVFSAVSDPVGAKLVASMDAPGSNITGTSDALNTNALIDLMLTAKPDTDYVGILYSKSEDSSTQAVKDAETYLTSKGIKFIEKTGTTADEVSAAADALVAEGVDAVFTPTDNTIQSAELGIYEKFTAAKIAHYGGADSFALNGAFCGYGVDYANLGSATADMVADILVNGKDPASTKVETFDNGIATVNTDTCTAIGLDPKTVESKFAPLCTQVVETTTQKEFSN